MDDEGPPKEIPEGRMKILMAAHGIAYKAPPVLVVVSGRMYKREDKIYHLLDDRPMAKP